MEKAQTSTHSSSLAELVEVVDRLLDKGIVVDAWAKVSLVGIELRIGRDVPEVRRSDRPDRYRGGSGVGHGEMSSEATAQGGRL